MHVTTIRQQETGDRGQDMKTASLGLLEVIVVRAYAGGRWRHCLPLFAVELRILLSSIFGKKNPLVIAEMLLK
jgi:hypothetical protein